MSDDELRPEQLVLAPMAGPPTTPKLVAAVASTGSDAFTAAGMINAKAMAAQILHAREILGICDDAGTDTNAESGDDASANTGDDADTGRIGVNIFVPDYANAALDETLRRPDEKLLAQRRRELAEYRERLAPIAAEVGVELPGIEQLTMTPDEDFAAKIDAVVELAVPVVSFTFGLPDSEVFARLHGAGIEVGVTVTCEHEAVEASAAGADFLTVQGPEAGGHRSTLSPFSTPESQPLSELLCGVRARLPEARLVAAGGMMDAAAARVALEAGADAVQCGTAFLLADEAGTAAHHRAALEQAAAGTGFTASTPTRVFTGRVARALNNAMLEQLGQAPALYPQVNQLTTPIKKAVRDVDNPQFTQLWAGANASEVRGGSAAEIALNLRGVKNS